MLEIDADRVPKAPSWDVLRHAEMQHADLIASIPLLHAESPPLRVTEGGAIRVARGRVTVDLIVEQFENGMTPEEMVRAYDTLVLADVYAVIAYYLRNQDDVRAYLRRRKLQADSLREKIEAEHRRLSREELLTRRGAMEAGNAPAGK